MQRFQSEKRTLKFRIVILLIFIKINSLIQCRFVKILEEINFFPISRIYALLFFYKFWLLTALLMKNNLFLDCHLVNWLKSVLMSHITSWWNFHCIHHSVNLFVTHNFCCWCFVYVLYNSKRKLNFYELINDRQHTIWMLIKYSASLSI